MTDKIVYMLVTKGGGIDGRDHTDKGGEIVAASFYKEKLQKNKNLPWCNIVTVVIDDEQGYRQAMAKLSPVDKLFLFRE